MSLQRASDVQWDIHPPPCQDGWRDANETWAYASADDPTYTLTIPGDWTLKYSAGMRVKLTQTTVRYFIITVVAYSAGSGLTTLTLYGGTDYDLAVATITAPMFSTDKCPLGFPMDPAKWTVLITDAADRTQATPTQNTWYNLNAALQITIPIGCWKVAYQVYASASSNAAQTAASVQVTLSSASNSESDTAYTSKQYFQGASASILIASPFYVANDLNRATKILLYLNTRTISANQALIANYATTLIRAVSAYL